MVARGNVVFGSAADVVLVGLGDNVEFGMHASQIVPGVARQFVASYGQGDGGPAGRCWGDAVLVVGAACSRDFALTVGLVDLAVRPLRRCPGNRPCASGSTTTRWVSVPVLRTCNETVPAGTVAGLTRIPMPMPGYG